PLPLTTAELVRRPDDAALTFVAGRPPIYGRTIRYYEDPVFAARARTPAPLVSDRLPRVWNTWAGSAPAPSATLAVVGSAGSSESSTESGTLPMPTTPPTGPDFEWPFEGRTESPTPE